MWTRRSENLLVAGESFAVKEGHTGKEQTGRKCFEDRLIAAGQQRSKSFQVKSRCRWGVTKGVGGADWQKQTVLFSNLRYLLTYNSFFFSIFLVLHLVGFFWAIFCPHFQYYSQKLSNIMNGVWDKKKIVHVIIKCATNRKAMQNTTDAQTSH